jgi:OmpA-OmpF porin, OOP family
VHFGFDKDNLNKTAQEALDQLATDVASAKGYIITVEGGTDSVGPSDYNYALSERRADSVIQYLASKHGIPAHKIYLIGLGKDKPVDSNKTRDGRAKNRRVDVRLMTNSMDATAPAASAPPSMQKILLSEDSQLELLHLPRWSSFFDSRPQTSDLRVGSAS